MDYIEAGKIAVLVDGQFGSTGKGLLAAYLANKTENKVDIAVTNASANAGHTTRFKDPNRRDFVCFHLPTFGIIQKESLIYINAGAVIDVDVLLQEIEEHKVWERILIDPNVTVIDDKTKKEAKSVIRSGSTQKGVGLALSKKVARRDFKVAKQIRRLENFIGEIDLNSAVGKGKKVSMEVPQGFSLSINSKFYPYCTSRNCTVAAGLNDAMVNVRNLGKVSMSIRTYPIRVGNIQRGDEIGYSGNGYSDQKELSWEEIGVEPEITTVTKRVRRIFSWSDQQFIDACKVNDPDLIFLNFVNYLKSKDQFDSIMRCIRLNKRDEAKVIFGLGANIEDVVETEQEVFDRMEW